MLGRNLPHRPLLRRRGRYVWAAIILLCLVTLVSSALVIPFIFESPSMYYKFGWDKVLLRGGKMIGIVAALLLFLQLPLAGRLSCLDRIFSLPVLFHFHRFNAYAICLLALLHPLCVLIPDDLIMVPFAAKYWPEWVGVALLCLILCQVIVSRWRVRLSLQYPWWLRLHRFMGIAVAGALVIHVLFVSETFEQSGLPRTGVFVAAGCWLLLWVWVRAVSLQTFRRPFTVAQVTPAGKDAYALDLETNESQPFSYAPGQFAFISLDSKNISKETHPFTLASSPTQPGHLQVIIRCCGDWTDRIGTVAKGERVYIQGPFGSFTHLLESSEREMIMIAGGIGITPMLSMLRYMRDVADPRPTTLIWSNRSEAHLLARQELTKMQQELTSFQWIPIFTKEEGRFGLDGRLDKPMLARLLAETSRDAVFFLCGPPGMIQNLRAILLQLGFPKGSVRQELFSI